MTDERIIAYLLKDLPEEELERFEDECFASEDWPDQVSLVEADLIDGYLRSELAPAQRRSFEQNYLTTAARMERIRITAALLRHVDACAPGAEAAAVVLPPHKQTWGERLRALWSGGAWWPRAAVALATLALVAGAWWFSRQPSPHRPYQTIATLTLSVSNSERNVGGQDGSVKLARGTDALQISLTLSDASETATHYRAQLEDDNSAIKHSEKVLREDQFVRVTIPASQLARGRYALRLFAVKPDGTERHVPGIYYFNVE